MSRWCAAAGAASGLLAVGLGAFGAHALKDRLPADLLQAFETGARYQMYHALALLGAAGWSSRRGARLAAVAFAAGTVLFSGSLYLLALTGIRGWGVLTPFGGVAFLLGWGGLAWAAVRPDEPPAEPRPR